MLKVSVVLTCLNEEKYIGACLKSLLDQEYSHDLYEIVVSDGGSNDRTQEIVRELAQGNRRVKLIIWPVKGAAAGRNAGIRGAAYDYIAVIDADCTAPTSWLSILVRGFDKYSLLEPRLAAVGGTNIPPRDSSRFLRSLGIVLNTYIGSFNSIQGRRFAEDKSTASVASLNALYSKQALMEVGLYDEALTSFAEDADLNYRLSQKGRKFVALADSWVCHHLRATPVLWARNMFRYGFGRAILLRRHPRMWSIAFLLPLGFACGMLIVPLALLHPIFLTPLFYFPIIMGYSAYICRKRPSMWRTVVLIFILQHFAYALGEVWGLLKPKVTAFPNLNNYS